MQNHHTIKDPSLIKVWDPLVRSFHWILVAAFLAAYLSDDDFLSLHVWAGYTIAIAIGIRLLWGLVGTRHARFTDFVTSPKQAVNYAKETLVGRAKRYIGHNPAGGLMIIVMLVSLIITTVSGIALYGMTEHAGPMANIVANSGKFWENSFENLHEFFANFTVLLVVVHVAGVIFESLAHKENLILSMINGYKRKNDSGAQQNKSFRYLED